MWRRGQARLGGLRLQAVLCHVHPSLCPFVPPQTEPKEKSQGAVEGERCDPRAPAGLGLPSSIPTVPGGLGTQVQGGDTGPGSRYQGTARTVSVPRLPMSCPRQPARAASEAGPFPACSTSQQFITAPLSILLLLSNKPEQAQKRLKPRRSQNPAVQPHRTSQRQKRGSRRR